jgi:hypothetical protein
MKKHTPTREQLDALGNFAANEGRTWKAALRHAWETGDYPTGSDSASLQQLRNTYGPSWLMAFNVRSVGARYKASDMRQHGYGCACADCGREREDRKASDRQDCETPAGMEAERVAARAMIAEMEKPTGHPYKASTTSPLCEVCGERKINRYGTHGLPGLEQGDQQAPAEWSGSQCPVDPDGCWIDDETEEHVNAKTAERTAGHPVTA